MNGRPPMFDRFDGWVIFVVLVLRLIAGLAVSYWLPDEPRADHEHDTDRQPYR